MSDFEQYPGQWNIPGGSVEKVGVAPDPNRVGSAPWNLVYS